jgi:hypothetical protein
VNNNVMLLLVLVSMLVVVTQLALGVWLIARARYYRGLARTERIRLQIGDARCRLVNAAARGELSPASATFQQLYLTQTTLMRGTDIYPAISAAYWTKVLRFEKRGTSALSREAKHWTPEVRDVASQTADALRHIWIFYMPCGAFLRLMKHTLVALGIISYDAVERACDRILFMTMSFAERSARLMAFVTFRVLSPRMVGGDMRLVSEMRESERILRKALARAA